MQNVVVRVLTDVYGAGRILFECLVFGLNSHLKVFESLCWKGRRLGQSLGIDHIM